MKWHKVILASLSLLLLAVIPASAGWWDHPQAKEKLGLTDQQIEQLNSSALKQQRTNIDIRSQKQKIQLDLRELWRAEPPDEKAILAKTRELAKVNEQELTARTQQRLDHSKILTAEQRKMAREFLRDRQPQARRQAMGQQRMRPQFPAAPGGWGPAPAQPPFPQMGPPPGAPLAPDPPQRPRMRRSEAPDSGWFPMEHAWGSVDADEFSWLEDFAQSFDSLFRYEENDLPEFPASPEWPE